MSSKTFTQPEVDDMVRRRLTRQQRAHERELEQQREAFELQIARLRQRHQRRGILARLRDWWQR